MLHTQQFLLAGIDRMALSGMLKRYRDANKIQGGGGHRRVAMLHVAGLQ